MACHFAKLAFLPDPVGVRAYWFLKLFLFSIGFYNSIAAAVKRGGFALLIINQLSIDNLLGKADSPQALILCGFLGLAI